MPKRVLVCEDHAPTRGLIRTLLEAEKSEKFEVAEAATGADCIKAFDSLGPFDLVMLEVGGLHPSWGDMHLGPENALKALALLGGGTFLPVHWGTFSLAMHAWDQPAEALLELAPKADARLVMPRLGQPVEPDRAERIEPWWREVDTLVEPARADTTNKLPATMPFPID